MMGALETRPGKTLHGGSPAAENRYPPHGQMENTFFGSLETGSGPVYSFRLAELE
jgi:hypothetical protein